MRKYVIPFLFVIFLLKTICIPCASLAAQKTNTEGKGKKHSIVKGDTWYSIAKKYFVPYADLRAANPGASDNLHIGDNVLIPAAGSSKKPGAATEKKNAEESKKTVAAGYHTVKSGENLSMIARKYSVTVDQIMEWNLLKTKSLKAGQKLKVKALPQPKEQVAEKEGIVKPAVEKSVTEKPVSATSAVVKKDSLPAPVANPESTATHMRPKDTTGGKAGGKGEMLVPENQPAEVFAKGRKEVMEEGAAAWIEDQEINPGKYFALHRTAPIGTIVKVTNRMNRRTVFVKVVGKLPDTGENENIVLKISKAAADKLGVLDARFQAQLNYGVDEK